MKELNEQWTADIVGRLEKFYLALDELIRNNYISYNEP